MCPWGRLAAHMISVPAVASMALINFPGAMLFRSGEALRIVGVLARGLPDVIGFMRTARRLQRTVGLKLPPLTDILNWPGDFNISYTSARFQPDATKLGSTYRFVGPTIMQRPHDPDFPWDKLDPIARSSTCRWVPSSTTTRRSITSVWRRCAMARIRLCSLLANAPIPSVGS